MGFSTLGINEYLLNAIAKQGYKEPTPIQTAAIPVILSGKDVMAGAQTGTGKTAAFALPLLQKITEKQSEDHVIKTLVLTPTRELAQQVFKSFETYAKFSDIKSTLAYGGVSIKTQVNALKEGVDVLVATPGRLFDHIVNGTVNLSHVEYLVFDEADQLFELGFAEQMTSTDLNINKLVLNRCKILEMVKLNF